MCAISRGGGGDIPSGRGENDIGLNGCAVLEDRALLLPDGGKHVGARYNIRLTCILPRPIRHLRNFDFDFAVCLIWPNNIESSSKRREGKEMTPAAVVCLPA